MASKSLGTLTIDLIAKVGGFVSGLSQAERASQKWRKQVKEDASAAAAAMAGFATAVGAAAIGAGVAGYNLLKTTSRQITESDRWAKSLNMSTQSLLAWQYAAEKAGVSGDQMADIFKDIGDKIGDAVLNKSGEAVDALNALGLSAKKLAGETPDKQLLAISDALEKVKSNAEKTTILESLGNDLSKLLPLLDNGSEKLRQYMDAAKKFGVAPDDADIEKLVKVNALFEDMETQVNGVKIELAAGLASVDLSALQKSIGDMGDVFKDPAVIQGLTDLVGGVVDLATWLVKVGAEAGKLIDQYKGGQAVGLNASIPEIERRIKNLNADLDDKGVLASFNRLGMDVSGKQAERAELQKRLAFLKNSQSTLPEIKLPEPVKTNYSLGAGETNGKPQKNTSGQKLDSAFKSAERSYMRQIELIDTTGKKTAVVTEQQKLQFDIADGKLQGLNETQKKRLQYLALEVDRLNAVKKANEENAKVAAFVANLQAQNENARADLGVDVQGAGIGNKQRERLRERLSIERNYLDQQRELQSQYQSGDISQTVYDRETQALKDAQSERLEIQDDYYKQIDALQADWVTGARDGLADWVDDSTNYATSAADAMKSALSGISSNIVDMLNRNKASWKDWGVSVLKTLEQVMVNMAIANGVSSIGSLFGGASSSASSGTALQSYGAGLQFNAKGGVYSSSDLSQYSNSVVSSPTLFAFAKGAGLMGEAGPEAIMPLTRASDGSLGVRAMGTVGVTPGTGGAPQVNIQIDGNGNAQNQSSSGYEQFGREVGNFVDRRYRELIGRDISPGGAVWNMAKGGR
ncbi:phage tail tape measure protein [Escherichia coli]|uniref:phage tail tape measure protein n=1 Tax=Escherichia coli TaxID=562 RepID=UPI00181E56C9|nr:phage tail tape measure protein [Escherichia coli]EFE6859296.1 phage tail tape measure protein [Escherichia coli]EGB2408964.1 phage tail tape measure protein [Escherichia coli]MCB4483573.1 phage tail tape measure protein [Escherichia coli]CAK0703211.1 hypothetical protein FGAF467_15340 [Escherichia coli]HDD9043226.1 phage tail tape measure protein [Escherichia coli]